jgi:hypothetical protein
VLGVGDGDGVGDGLGVGVTLLVALGLSDCGTLVYVVCRSPEDERMIAITVAPRPSIIMITSAIILRIENLRYLALFLITNTDV